MIFFPISVDRNHTAVCGTSIGSMLGGYPKNSDDSPNTGERESS
jgi:hypothetical protein